MLNNDAVDRSYETAKNVVREESKSFTTNGNIRRLSLEILKLGFTHQFDDDRSVIRRTIDQLLTESISDADLGEEL